jgi:hypothetical protein
MSQPIKLVHVTTVPESLRFLIGQVGFMKERGFDVHAMSSPGEGLTRFAEKEGIATYAVEMPRRITPVKDVVAVARMWRVLRRIRPHIVHSHTPKGGVLGMVSAWLARVPVRIYHMRGLPFATATGWKRLLLVWSERISCGLAHRVFCVSPSVRQLALDTRIGSPDKIAVLGSGSGNGVDAEHRFNDAGISSAMKEETRRRYQLPPHAPIAEAWKVLRNEFPDLYLLLVGPYEPQDPIPPVVDEELRRDPRVRIIGTEWDTPKLYAIMDVLVLPTYREGFPNVLLEAAGMRVPVVTTRVPGCVDAVRDNVTGKLVPPYESDSLASAIREYLQNSELRRSHGLAARQWVLDKFRPQRIWQAIYLDYVCLLKRNCGQSFEEWPTISDNHRHGLEGARKA